MRAEWAACLTPGARLKSLGVIMLAPLAGVVLALPFGLGWYSPGPWEKYFVSQTTGIAWFATIGFAFRDQRPRVRECPLDGGLSGDAILFGKIGAGVGFGLAFWLAVSAASLMTLNLMQADGPWAQVPFHVIHVVVALEFLVTVSGGTGTTLIALGASTIRQVYTVAFSVLGGLALSAFAVVHVAGDLGTTWLGELQRFSVPMQFAIAAMVAFATVDVALVLFARSRFKGRYRIQD